MSGFNFNLNAGTFSFDPSASGFEPTPPPQQTTPPPQTTTTTMTPPQTQKVKKDKPKKKVEVVETSLPKEEIEWVDSESSGDAEDFKEHVNICFIGHVDHGKSTISGNILLQTGMVDTRTMEKYQKEAVENGRDSWFLAFIVDTDQDERERGKTVEVGRAHFNTVAKRYTILDAPGHKDYVPNMIAGVSQADVAILICSARTGEFEAGFDKNGQTREHAMIAKTVGIKHLIIAVNKMDEDTVQWSQERFNEIKERLNPFLKGTGFKKAIYVPISGYTGQNLLERVPSEVCPWYEGESLLTTLDMLPPIARMNNAPLRIPILDKYRDRGHTIVIGKVESGTIRKEHSLSIAPGYHDFPIAALENDDTEVTKLKGGENIKILLRQVQDDEIQPGYVIYRKDLGPPVTQDIVATVITMSLPYNRLFTSGMEVVMHIHTCVVEVTVVKLLEEKNMKTGKRVKVNPPFARSRSMVVAHLRMARPIAVEKYADYPQLGRFTLRDEGKTIAFGTIIGTQEPRKRT